MKRTILAAFALWATAALGATTTLRQIDNIQNSIGGSSLSVPSVGSAFATDTNTLTLTNKSLSGSANTFTNIPASAVSSGQLAVANGGTGDSTLTLNGILFGNGTSAVGITAAGSQYQVFQAGASGVPTVDAVHLDQSAATTGTLPVNRGGTGAASLTANNVILGNGTSAVTFVAPGTSGNVLTSNGTTWTSAAASSGAPTINNSQASPQSVTAAGGITLSAPTYFNYVFVVSNSGSVTVTATPSITACTAAGQSLTVIGESASNIITLQDEAGLAGAKLHLNGNWTSGLNSSLTLYCDGNGFWNEKSRYN